MSTSGASGRVVIGMDPHKRSATIEVMTGDETIVGGERFAADRDGFAAMLRYVGQSPDRVWAIEGCAGIGKHIAMRLLADGEEVVDVPPKLSASSGPSFHYPRHVRMLQLGLRRSLSRGDPDHRRREIGPKEAGEPAGNGVSVAGISRSFGSLRGVPPMTTPRREDALDHVVLVWFENRSLDNVLGRLYQPGEVESFEGVVGKDLSNPIPEWAEHGADRKRVPYGIATDMDSPNPDSGEEYFHTNTQLFNTLDEHNRFKIGEGVTAPWNAPPVGASPSMDGFVTDYISTFTGEMGRQPTYDEYAHIMTGYTPEQVPVLSGIAREFGVFDHWFCEVPPQTFMNRSFWTAATSSGLVVNPPARKWFTQNDAETLFERLEAHGKTWKVYVMEPMPVSFAGVIHHSRLHDRLATHFVRFEEFEKDAAAGTLPDFALIEPDMVSGHGDYHPAFGRSIGPGVEVGMDPPSSILAGEALLERVFNAYRSATSETGANVWNTTLLIGWDEPGGTYDHVPPGPVPPPDPAAPAGEFGFTFDRSGYRVPAIIVSPWVEPGSVYTEEYRHTSLIATVPALLS